VSQQIYFISDLHLGHKNILTFGQRQHNDIEDMHIAMLEAWNNKVRKQRDIVYVLGDVCMNVADMRWLDLMNGQKRLVLGNHDQLDYGVYRKYFDKIYHFHKGYGGMVFTHIPIHPGELAYRNWKWNIHGHIHRKEQDIDDPRYFNVNVDIIGYAPISLDELREQLQCQNQ